MTAGLLGAFDGAMAGLTEADLAAFEPQDHASNGAPIPSGERAPVVPAGQAGAADRPATEPPAPGEPAVDPRAQAVADRLLGRGPARTDSETAAAEPAGAEAPGGSASPRAGHLVAAEGGASATCTPTAPVVVGRAEADLCVPLGVVSRRHCVVRWENDRPVVSDLGSANGTIVCRPGGDTVTVSQAPVELGPGDVLATARGRRPIARFELGADLRGVRDPR